MFLFFCSIEKKFLQTETVISELKKTIAQQQIEINHQQEDIQRIQVDSVYLEKHSGNVSSRQKRQGKSYCNYLFQFGKMYVLVKNR